MKKLLLSAVAFASMLTANFSTAQLADGTTAPDWTFTDINGTSWNLYTLTAQGKTVFIDVSATWCPPCWNYHSSHALKDLYLEHGPNGTLSNDVMVFYIEGDNTTTSADLNGTGTNTQGDWVSGTPYPIIDLQGSAETTFNSNYAISGFPTIYKVCPNNKIYEVGQQNTAGLVNSINSCPFATDAYTSDGPASLQCSGTFAPTVSLKNNGQSALTSCTLSYQFDGTGSVQTYNWSGNLAAGQTASVTLPQQTFSAGAHTLTVTTSAPNGGTDNNNTNNIQEYTFTISTANSSVLPLSNSFSSSTFPYTNWILENADNGTTWARVSINSGSLKYDCFNYSAAGQKDAFVIEPVSLASTVNPSLNFKVAHARYSASYTEKLEVFVSTDCGQTWTSKWVKSGTSLATAANTTSAFTPTSSQWRAECVDLSAYAGQDKVFVKFVGTNSYGNNMYVDDISISDAACVAAGVEENETATFTVYPNPAKDNVQVDLSKLTGSYVVEVMDLQGRILSNQSGNASGDKNILSISLDGVAKGTYMISVYNNNSKESKTIVVE